jgi:hypothetical protein
MEPFQKSMKRLSQHRVSIQNKAALIGIRGYYPEMRVHGKNARKVYDDAIFVVSRNAYASFNANTDPSGEGWNAAINKPYATLKPGVWRFVQGWHKKGQPSGHRALRQPENYPFTVIRDAAKGKPSYEEKGYFAINLHRGGEWSTSSWGCQTIVPSQWDAFINLVYAEMNRYGQKFIEYLLVADA